jgi:CHAT domain
MTAFITFLAPGQTLPKGYAPARRDGTAAIAAPLPTGPRLAAVALAPATARDGSAAPLHALQAEVGQDVVVLHLDTGPALVLHPETARDLLLAQADGAPVAPRARGAGRPPADTLVVPTSLAWAGAPQRGWLQRVVLKAIEIFRGKAEAWALDAATGWVADRVLARFDGHVTPGLYRLQPDTLPALGPHATRVDRADAAPDGGPLLVLLHGTFSDTPGTFGPLWARHPEQVRALFDHYGGRVYALDHPTLGHSPIANALALAQALPAGARVHLLTHSRGGLVAEVLARLAAQPRLTPADLAPFADSPGRDYSAHRRDLGALAALLAQQPLTVERVVRVACPARGTLLASRRLDAYLSVLKWGLELVQVPVLPSLVDFLGQVAQRRTDPGEIPGLEAMIPDSPLVRWLNGAAASPEPVDDLPGDLRVIAGDLAGGGSLRTWLKTLMADTLYWQDNDLVVHTRSMYGGGRRAAGRALFVRDESPETSHFDYFANPRTARCVVDALVLAAPPGFGAIGLQSWGGADSGGARGPAAARAVPAGVGVWHRLAAAAGQDAAAVTLLPEAAATAAPLAVEVVNGHLRSTEGALLLGHYRGLRLTGTESVMDHLLHGALTAALRAGIYPEAIGRHRLFARPRPAGGAGPAPTLLIAGLGDEGSLGVPPLVETVRLAVIGCAQQVWEQAGHPTRPAPFDLTSTLLGSGGSGVSPGLSAQAIVQGVMRANERLAAVGWPVVRQLRLIELYLDRASDAWRALAVMAPGSRGRLALAGQIRSGEGPLRRPADAGYRSSGHDHISAVQGPAQPAGPGIVYTLDTRRARAEVRAQGAQGPLLRELLAQAAQDTQADRPIGASLFQLLVPVELEPFLAGSGQLLLELDDVTAAIPWELLAPPEADPPPTPEHAATAPPEPPWAIRCQLLRRLRLAPVAGLFRAQPVPARRSAGLLVVGEPRCTGRDLPPLPGARAEAQGVADLLRQHGAPVTELIDEDTLPIVHTLLGEDWRLIHIAGHGLTDAQGGGVALAGDAVLGPREIAAMRTVPDLVFINCCHLAHEEWIDARAPQRRGHRSSLGDQRPVFAASVARQLIGNGVRCVVACGWAVDDAAALAFALAFYARLLDGQRFLEAVSAGRLAAWQTAPHGNTWAAYQCYGDPDWTLVARPDDADAPPPERGARRVAVEAIPSAAEFIVHLEALITDSRSHDGADTARRAALEQLQAHGEPLWGDMGVVQEALGLAHAQLGQRDRAIDSLRAACTAADGSASLRAADALCEALLARARPAPGSPAPAGAGRDLDEARQRNDALLALHPHAQRVARAQAIEALRAGSTAA